MTDHAGETPNQNNCGNQAAGYLEKAAEACAAGDTVLGMHLYLAAYEQAAADPSASTSVEVAALRAAWRLSCDLKERSLAEYVFEKLEPYLTGEEIASCAMKLQELALDRLEQYGFSREELEDMAETITQDFLGENARIVKVESISIPNMGAFGASDAMEAAVAETRDAQPASVDAAGDRPDVEFESPIAKMKDGKPSHVDMSVASADDFNPYEEFNSNSVGTSYHAATVEGSGAYVFTRDADRANAWARAREQEAQAQEAKADAPGPSADEEQAPSPDGRQDDVPSERPAEGESPRINLAAVASMDPAKASDVLPAMPEEPASQPGVLNYRNLVGYDEAVSVMRDFGIGLQNDPGFISFVRMLNARHGLSRMPAIDTLLFRAPVIEDALRFVDATIGELGLPILRMTMEEGMGGMPVLCVTTNGNNRPRMNHAHNRFEGPGILVIDDLDAWGLPEMPESPEGFGGFLMANISRGAREAVNLIRSAVEDPDVFVLVTASAMGDPDPFFYELLEPITIVDIGYPTDKERYDIWTEIARDHPSVRSVDRKALMRYSEGLARYDMYMAAREALEDAYKLGLVQRAYVPVTPQNLFDKLAACQPLDSDQYRALEEAVIDDFKHDLDHLEDLLGGRG